jgi:FG-GAP-like repeat
MSHRLVARISARRDARRGECAGSAGAEGAGKPRLAGMAIVGVALLAGCRPASERAPPPAPGAPPALRAPPALGAPPPGPQADAGQLEPGPRARAAVTRAETSDPGETRLYSGAVVDLDGDGAPELIAGGFSAQAGGRRSTIRVYRQRGDAWLPLTEGGWDGGAGSTVRNVAIADVDGDGQLDVLALGRLGASSQDAQARLAMFGLEGDQLVKRAEVEWRDGQYTHGYGLAIGDLDGDGAPDIVTGGFQSDGTHETGFVRVWSVRAGELVARATALLDGQGSPSMRVNDLAVGDVDGDGRPEIVAVGRHGPRLTEASKEAADQRREIGDLSVLAFTRGALAIRSRHSWSSGTSLRLRAVVVGDLDADRRAEIVAGGQYDADGKPALAVFGVVGGKLVLRSDASSTVTGVTGEVKDLILAGLGQDARVIAIGVSGDKPGRYGDVTAWRFAHGELVSDTSLVSHSGEATSARAVLVVPGPAGPTVFTIGHAKTRTTMVGQVLRWRRANHRR